MKSLIEIEQVVCDVFGVTSEFIHEKTMADRRPIYRYIIGYICFEINGKLISLKRIAKYFDIDHATMWHGLKVIQNEIDTYTKFKADIIECFEKLGEKTSLGASKETIKNEIFKKLEEMHKFDNLSTCAYLYLKLQIEKL